MVSPPSRTTAVTASWAPKLGGVNPSSRSTFALLVRTPVSVVHLDAQLLVVDKPAGLLSVPGRGADKADCLASRVLPLCADALTVHRLDMATSGLVVFGRGVQMQRRLSIAFAQRELLKHYEAVVSGLPEADFGEISLPVLADWPRRPLQKVDLAHGKPSLTRWQVLAREPRSGTSRLALQPLTGRTHQLRLHLAAIGHPILGDALYAPAAVAAAAPRLLLHAQGLALPAGATGSVALDLRCPVPF